MSADLNETVTEKVWEKLNPKKYTGHWSYFSEWKKDVAICLVDKKQGKTFDSSCKSLISVKYGSPKGLKVHLESAHNIFVDSKKPKLDEESQSSIRNFTVTKKFSDRNGWQSKLAKMVAEGFFTMNCFVKNSELRKMFEKENGVDLPRSFEGI